MQLLFTCFNLSSVSGEDRKSRRSTPRKDGSHQRAAGGWKKATAAGTFDAPVSTITDDFDFEHNLSLFDKKRVFKECLALVMDSSETENLHHLHAMAENVFVPGYMEAKGNYDDAKQLERLCILKADPALKFGLANMAVLGSSILSLIRFAVILKEIEPEDGKRFAEGSQERRVLEAILEGLDIEEDKYNVSAYKIAQRKERGKHRDRPDIPTCGSSDEGPRVVPAHTTFTHLCMFICNYIRHREIRLDEVKFGFVGMQHTSEGQRSRFPVPPHTLYEDDSKVCSEVTKEKKEG